MRNKLFTAVLAVTVCALLTGCGDSKSVAAEKKYRKNGIDAMVTGKYEDAVTAFNKALGEAKNGVGELELDICYYKAEAQYNLGDVSGAMETYSAIIDYNDESDAHYLRGNLYFASGDYENGAKDFAAAAEKDRKNYELYIGIYETMAKYGMQDEAKKYLESAQSFGGNGANDLMQKGRIAWLLGDAETAVAELEKAIEKGKTEALFYLAQVYRGQGDTQKAENCLNEYIESGKANAETLITLGEGALNSSDYQTALEYFKAAEQVEHEASLQRLEKDMIIAYEYTGDFAKARELMEAYTENYPADYDAEDELIFLQTR